jgi:hypothetical protein
MIRDSNLLVLLPWGRFDYLLQHRRSAVPPPGSCGTEFEVTTCVHGVCLNVEG